jgi:hypothetical protein
MGGYAITIVPTYYSDDGLDRIDQPFRTALSDRLLVDTPGFVIPSLRSHHFFGAVLKNCGSQT